MKKRFATLLFILIMLVACNGGSVGPMGPPGPAGPPGADGICTSEQCEVPEELITEIMVIRSALEALEADVAALGDGGSIETYRVGVDIYCDGSMMNADAIKDVDAVIQGDIFSCQFKIDNGGRVNEPCNAYYCVPRSDGQPSGFAEFFDGVGRYLGGAGSHNRTVNCISEWKRPPGARWGVRIECPGYDPFSEDQLLGGAKYIGKRFPWTANTDDHWQITITIP